MKKNLLLVALLFIYSDLFAQDEISLFNHDGEAVAYIDSEDDDLTIYLWSGRPVAYLFSKSGEFHVYGFNGTHLGWFIDGIIRNHDGMLLGLQRRQLQCIHNMSHTRDIRSINPTKVTAIMPHTNPILVALGAQ